MNVHLPAGLIAQLGIEWSLKNDGQIFGQVLKSQHLKLESWYLEFKKIKQVLESCILKFESQSLASQAKV